MQFSASQIAQLINGKVEGDANIAVASLEKLKKLLKVSLLFANAKYEDFYTALMHPLLLSAKHMN